MNYATPYDIGIGDKVLYKGSEYDVLINYIKGETDAKGYNPAMNRTVLIDSTDTRTTCLDYKELNVIEQITDDGRLIWWLFVINLSQDTPEEEKMASNLSVLNVNQSVQFITLTGQD